MLALTLSRLRLELTDSIMLRMVLITTKRRPQPRLLRPLRSLQKTASQRYVQSNSFLINIKVLLLTAGVMFFFPHLQHEVPSQNRVPSPVLPKAHGHRRKNSHQLQQFRFASWNPQKLASILHSGVVPVSQHYQRSVVTQRTAPGSTAHLGQGVSPQHPDTCRNGGTYLLPGKVLTWYCIYYTTNSFYIYLRPSRGRTNGVEALQQLRSQPFKTSGTRTPSMQLPKTAQTLLSGQFLLKTKNHHLLLGPVSMRPIVTIS